MFIINYICMNKTVPLLGMFILFLCLFTFFDTSTWRTLWQGKSTFKIHSRFEQLLICKALHLSIWVLQFPSQERWMWLAFWFGSGKDKLAGILLNSHLDSCQPGRMQWLGLWKLHWVSCWTIWQLLCAPSCLLAFGDQLKYLPLVLGREIWLWKSYIQKSSKTLPL